MQKILYNEFKIISLFTSLVEMYRNVVFQNSPTFNTETKTPPLFQALKFSFKKSMTCACSKAQVTAGLWRLYTQAKWDAGQQWRNKTPLLCGAQTDKRWFPSQLPWGGGGGGGGGEKKKKKTGLFVAFFLGCLKAQLRAPGNKPARGKVLYIITETGESWEGRCAGVSRSVK